MAELKAPILRAIEQVTGHAWRIENFNDHPTTTHALVLSVLHQAREKYYQWRITSASAKDRNWGSVLAKQRELAYTRLCRSTALSPDTNSDGR